MQKKASQEVAKKANLMLDFHKRLEDERQI